VDDRFQKFQSQLGQELGSGNCPAISGLHFALRGESQGKAWSTLGQGSTAGLPDCRNIFEPPTAAVPN